MVDLIAIVLLVPGLTLEIALSYRAIDGYSPSLIMAGHFAGLLLLSYPALLIGVAIGVSPPLCIGVGVALALLSPAMITVREGVYPRAY